MTFLSMAGLFVARRETVFLLSVLDATSAFILVDADPSILAFFKSMFGLNGSRFSIVPPSWSSNHSNKLSVL